MDLLGKIDGIQLEEHMIFIYQHKVPGWITSNILPFNHKWNWSQTNYTDCGIITVYFNALLFYGSFFLQLQGPAMRKPCGPLYVNVFLGLWGRDLFLVNQTAAMDCVILWTRYIDDIFMIWQRSGDQLQDFECQLNAKPVFFYRWTFS